MLNTRFKEVLFLSLDNVRLIAPSKDTIVVSVLDLGEIKSFGRPSFEGFHDSLELSFEDTFEEMKLKEDGDWADNPSDEDHARFCQSKGERIPTLEDALKIVSFLDKHAGKNLKLLVHCKGGVSRSAAIASWVSSKFWIPFSNDQIMPTDHANTRVVRLLEKAYTLGN